MDMGFIKMDTVMKMTDGKCLAIENVTVPAGTFKCHKITQTTTTSTMGVNDVTRTIYWYAPAIGAVKTEIYDNKDKLSSSSVLIEKKGD
jgi:arginine deiminase